MKKIAVCILLALALLTSASAETALRVHSETSPECLSKGKSAFCAANEGVSVRITDDYEDRRRVLDALTTRDGAIDVYILSCNNSSFEAARDRGYLLELDKSDALADMAEDMSPTLREALLSNGRLVAYPIDGWLFAPRVNATALSALGVSTQDIPGDWLGFLEWLPGLAERFLEGEGYSLLGTRYSAEEARQALFFELFGAYQQNLSRDHTDLMKKLLEALERIDFQALGHPESVADRHGEWMDIETNESRTLFTFGVATGLERLMSDKASVPFLLAIDADAVLTLNSDVIMINPYTANPDLAIAFVESVVNEMDISTRYALYPNLREPVENPEYKELLRSAQANYDAVIKKIEEAEDMEKQALQERLQAAEAWLSMAETDKYIISAEDVAWYRQNSENVRLEENNWLYRDNSGAAADLVNRYLGGELSAERFMDLIDEKLQMMANEGY